MKVRELQTILQDLHPDDEVGLRSASRRNMTFLGVDKEASAEFGHLVLTVDFTIADKPVESARDILKRQEEEIKKAIAKMDKEELRAEVSKKRHKSKKQRTDVQLLLDGYISDGRKGRPRKILTEEEIAEKVAMKERSQGRQGRPKKEVPPPAEKAVENSQDFSQLDNLLGL